MRRLLLLLCLMGISALAAVPVARTIINTTVYHASASENRCVTGHFTSSVSENLTHLTLWDTSNPVYPRQGITIVSNYTWGLHSFRQPTLRGNLLFYMDSFVLRIVDISNIDAPQQLAQVQVTYMLCFALWEHYVVLGTSEGAMMVFDITDPTQPTWVSTTTVPGCVYKMWACDNGLAASCGSAQNNTARLFSWDSSTQNFVEESSIESGGRLNYVGTMTGRIVLSKEDGNVHVYNHSPGTEPVLIQNFAGGSNLRQVLCSGDRFYAFSQDNCVRIWQIDASNAMNQIGHYDLSHLSLEQGALWEIHGNRLIYSVDTLILMILDVADLSAPVEFVDKFSDETVMNNIVIPEGTNWLYYNNEDRLGCVKVDNTGMLSEGREIPDNGYLYKMLEYRQNLYLLCRVNNALVLRVLNVSHQDSPCLIAELPVSYAQIFTVKSGYLYMGSILSVGKYLLDANGVPILERTLSYTIPQNGYEVYFLDIATYAGFDYGIGMWGDLFSGYSPILVYWLPDDSAGFITPPYLLYSANVIGQFLYLTGQGVNILRLDCGIPRLDNIQEVNNHTRGVECTVFVDDLYMIECYAASNQIRIYDLMNPRNPQLIHTIYQAHNSNAMGVIGKWLLCANDSYGIECYELPIVSALSDETAPEIPQAKAWPNPFQDKVEISVKLSADSSLRYECFNIRGQRVWSQSISDAKAGENVWSWDGKDQNGQRCPAGIYIIRIHTADSVLSKKITRIY